MEDGAQNCTSKKEIFSNALFAGEIELRFAQIPRFSWYRILFFEVNCFDAVDSAVCVMKNHTRLHGVHHCSNN